MIRCKGMDLRGRMISKEGKNKNSKRQNQKAGRKGTGLSAFAARAWPQGPYSTKKESGDSLFSAAGHAGNRIENTSDA